MNRPPSYQGVLDHAKNTMNTIGIINYTQKMRPCNMHPIEPNFFFLWGGWRGVGPFVFPMCSHHVPIVFTSSSQWVTQHVPNSVSLCPMCSPNIVLLKPT